MTSLRAREAQPSPSEISRPEISVVREQEDDWDRSDIDKDLADLFETYWSIRRAKP